MVRFEKVQKKMALAAVTMAAVTAAVVAMPSTALADETGLCGPNNGVRWSYSSSSGAITFSPTDVGDGVIARDTWFDKYYSDITSVKIEKGVKAQGDISGLFCYMHDLITVDASGLDTSQVTDISHVFSGDDYLETVDVTGWDVSSVTGAAGTFLNCDSLKTIYSSTNWTTNGYINSSSDMFVNCYNLVGGAGTCQNNPYAEYKTYTGQFAKIDGVSDGIHTETKGYFTDKNATPSAATTATTTTSSVKGAVYKIKAKKGSKVKLPYTKGVKYKLAKKSKLFKVSKKGVVKSLKKLKKGKTYKIKVKMTQGKKTQKVTVKIKVVK